MKKLVLLLTILSFYNIIAMDQTVVIEDPNAPDQQGNTPLQNTVIAWQQCNTKAKEKGVVYEKLKTLYKRIEQEITAEQSKNQEDNSALVALNAQCQTVLKKAAMVKAELASFKQQADSHKKTAIALIENGAYVNIPHLNDAATLKWEIVYAPLQQAIINGSMETIEKYLQIGANPDFKHPDGRNALAISIERNNSEVAKKFLFAGAKLTSIVSFGRTTGSILLVAANRGTYEMVETLLVSPQASPSVYSSTFDPKKTHQEMFTFLCYMLRNKELPKLPIELRQKIYKFLLPIPESLINSIPLKQLPKYVKFLGKKTLISALTERHMLLLHVALTTKSYISIDGESIALPPYKITRCREFNDIDLRQDAEAVKSALDPANIEQHRVAIAANYAKLLE